MRLRRFDAEGAIPPGIAQAPGPRGMSVVATG